MGLYQLELLLNRYKSPQHLRASDMFENDHGASRDQPGTGCQRNAAVPNQSLCGSRQCSTVRQRVSAASPDRRMHIGMLLVPLLLPLDKAHCHVDTKGQQLLLFVLTPCPSPM